MADAKRPPHTEANGMWAGVRDRLNDARSWTQQLRTDRKYRRSVFWGSLADIVVCACLVYLVFALPQHTTLLKRGALWIALVLCPFLLFVMVVRSPLGRSRIQQGYKILPFETLKTKPDFEGSALAAFLEREIAAWRIRATGQRMLKSPVDAPAGATLSVAGATVSLTWLWTRLLAAVTGNADIVIAGLLVDTDAPLRLRVWRSNHNGSGSYWEETLGDGPVADALGTAMAKLAFDVLEELEPLTAGAIDNYRWRDEDAIRLMCSKDRSPEQDLQLAFTYITAGYLAEGDGVLQELKYRRLRGGVYWQAQTLEAQLRVIQGNFGTAESLFVKIADNPVCTARWASTALKWSADALAAQGDYRGAIAHYDRLLAFLRGAAGASSTTLQKTETGSEWEQLAKALGSRPAGIAKDDVDFLLDDNAQALINRARSQMMLHMQALEPLYDPGVVSDIKAAREVLQVKDELSGATDNELTALTDTLMADIASEQGDYALAERCALEAANIYAAVLARAEEDRLADPRNMQAQASVAWSCFHQAISYDYVYNSRAKRAAAKAAAAAAAPAGQSGVTPEQKPGAAPAPEEDAASTSPEKAGLSSSAQSADASPLEQMQATDPETHDIVLILLGVPSGPRRAAITQIDRANAQWDGQRHDKYVWAATLGLCEAVLRNPGLNKLGFLQFSVDHPCKGAQPDQSVLAEIDKLAQQYEPATDLNQSEVRSYCMALHGLLKRTSARGNIDKLNEVMDTESARTKFAAFVDRCQEEFARLGRGVRRSAAEASYGLACIAARNGDGVKAALRLREASIREGEGTFAYRNRARQDEYFLRVWNQPGFQALLPWKGAPGTIPVESITTAAAAATQQDAVSKPGS